MKKNLIIIFIAFIWNFSVFGAETEETEETMLRGLLYYSVTGEKKIQELNENYICKQEIVDILKSKYDERFGFVGSEKNFYYSKYGEKKIKSYIPATSLVKIKKELYPDYEWLTYEIDLVRHKLTFKTYEKFIPIYDYIREDYLLKEYQKRDLRILLRKVFDLDKVLSNKINLRETLIQQHKIAQEIFESLEDKPIKTSKLYCTRTNVTNKK